MEAKARGRGRPRKSPDINYPRRIESQRMIQEMVGQNERISDNVSGLDRTRGSSGHRTEDDSTLDKRAIVIHPPETPRVQEETEDDELSVLDQKEQQWVNYRCADCGALLIENQSRCSCGSRLHWDRIDA